MSNTLKFRRGPEGTLPVLAVGEPAFTTDTKKLYIGDGTANNFIGPGGAGSNIHTAQATLNFGTSNQEDFNASVTVSASWVTASTTVLCNMFAKVTTDHDPDDYVVEGVSAIAGNIVPGVSFDVLGTAPQGTWGRYIVNCIGV